MSRTTFINWWQGLPIPWLVAGFYGQREQWPGAIDDALILLDSARKVAYPNYAPSDALAHIGNDRCLIQGASESDTSFRTRLRDAWAQWNRAGTPLSVLEQLEFYGLRGATWVQQNGLQFSLSAAPTAGVDPTPLLVVSNTQALSAPLTSTVYPYRVIPAGTPWYAFDGNTDLTNRFAIILPSWPFSSMAFATFSNTDSVAITWPVPFTDTTYRIICGTPNANVTITLDGTTKTTTGITVQASAPWAGTISVIAYAVGTDPLNTFSTASIGAVKRIIQTFRPNAICTGVSIIQSGRVWGFPATAKWGDVGAVWGGTTYQLSGAF